MRRLFHWAWVPSLQLLLAFSGCTVIVSSNNGSVKSIAVTPASPSIVVGGKQQFTANVTFGDGTTIVFRTDAVQWSTSSPKVATISGNGLATGLSAGASTITATLNGVSGSTTLGVMAMGAPPVQLSGSATQLDVSFLAAGTRFLFVANPTDDTVQVFQKDSAGRSERLIEAVSVIPARAPEWLAIDREGEFLYVANVESANISVFSIDPSGGRLMQIAGSPFDIGEAPLSIAISADGSALIVSHLTNSAVTRLRISSGALLPE